jgi:tetratricopeptide (TPR) repeat protein
VAYESLLKRLRRIYHGVVADWLIEHGGERAGEITSLIGEHLELAGRAAEAADYLGLAAASAAAKFANEEAIRTYRRGLRLLQEAGLAGREELAARLSEGLGDLLSLTGAYEEARATYRDALSHVGEHDRMARSRLARKDGRTWVAQRQPVKALEAYDRAEAALESAPDRAATEWRHEWLECQLDRVGAHYWLAQSAEMVELAEKMQPVVEREGTPVQRARFFFSLVLMGLRRDRYRVSDETLAHARAGLEASRESGVWGEILTAVFEMGFCHVWRGELDPAESWLQDALQLAEQMGDAERKVLSLSYLTVVCRKRGDVERVRALIPRSLAAAQAAGMPMYIALAKANRAWVAARSGNAADAETDARAAMDLYAVAPAPVTAFALWPLIGVELARGQHVEAIEHARQALQPPQHRLPARLETVTQEATRAWEGGDVAAARSLMNEVVELAKQAGYL